MGKYIEHDIKKDIEQMKLFDKKLSGKVILNEKEYQSVITKKEDYFSIVIDDHHNISHNTLEVPFYSDKINLNLIITINTNSHNLDKESLISKLISKGKIYEMSHIDFNTKGSYYSHSYYEIENSHFLRKVLGDHNYFELLINHFPISLSYSDEYLMIKSNVPIKYEHYFDVVYNLLVAIGFVSGNFVQNKVYHFHRLKDDSKEELIHYRKLRSSCNSIYQSLTTNSYGYKHMIGDEYATKLYKAKILQPFDTNSLMKLTELIANNRQILYAIVLFCEANGNNLSLLVKNNCFYVVLEVLKKFFYEEFKDSLPDDYSKFGNIKKYKAVFEQIAPISDDNIELIRRRNTLLHGDIKDLFGDEMFEIMLKQMTLINRLVITYIGFDGHIIDHYHLRNSGDEKSFIKLN